MPTDLFSRNGIISADGRLGGVLNPPLAPQLPALQAELTPLFKEAERRHVMLRVGVLEGSIEDDHGPVLVYAIDLHSPHDKHGFIRRLGGILAHHDVQPLDFDLDSDVIFDLTRNLASQTRPKSAW